MRPAARGDLCRPMWLLDYASRIRSEWPRTCLFLTRTNMVQDSDLRNHSLSVLCPARESAGNEQA